MDSLSNKTVELFAGAEALSNSLNKTYASILSNNMKCLEDIHYLTDKLNDICCPELIRLSQISRDGFNNVLSSEMMGNVKRMSEIFEKMDFSELAKMKHLNIPKLEINFDILHIHDPNLPERDQANEVKVSEKILSEILLPESKKIITPDSPIITVAPINDEVLRYLKENPEEWFKLTGGQFEMVMQEIYSRLGYQVERTKATRDGGKDLIIRKNEPVGDLIYYVECKKYAPNRPIGVGIVREFKCTIDTDSVNGGIIATTSHFAKGASDFILNNNFDCKVKMHDGAVIKRLLNQVC